MRYLWTIVSLILALPILFLLRERTPLAAPREVFMVPTMLEMTFPEFEAAVRKSPIALIPIAAIEEHGPHLPLGTDSILAVGQLVDVERYLGQRGVEALVGPHLNVGITNESGDWARDGTYAYPGSLTLREDTFVALYLDLLRSLDDQGLRRMFLYSAHFGPRHVNAVARIIREAEGMIGGAEVYALIPEETMSAIGLTPTAHLLPIERGRNFELLDRLLGHDTGGMPTSAHADGAETSEMLYRRPELVRSGYRELSSAPSSRFFEAYKTGDRTRNPTGMGGFPLARATAAAGEALCDYRTRKIGDTILRALASHPK